MNDGLQEKVSFGRVVVLMGGMSSERDISLESGDAVLDALLSKGIEAVGIDVDDNILSKLMSVGADRAFIALHGRGGEDGVIQGALQALEIPYTGSDILGSALTLDKCRSKEIWQCQGLPTPQFLRLRKGFKSNELITKLGLPLAIKPIHEGSSFGVTRVDKEDQLDDAWQVAASMNDSVFAESWISGQEYTAAILGGIVLPLIQIVPARSYYDYEAKYYDKKTNFICPVKLDEEKDMMLKIMALDAFNSLGASGWGRVDFILDDEGKPWLLEVNTIPGMTSHSLVPIAAKAAGMTFKELVVEILGTSMHKNR